MLPPQREKKIGSLVLLSFDYLPLREYEVDKLLVLFFAVNFLARARLRAEYN